MAPVPVTAVISATSEDTKYPASNILENQKWLTSNSDNQERCEVVLQLRIPSVIHFIDIGYINASSIEISVGCSWWPSTRPYETILSSVSLQTANEARTGKNKVGCKMFNCPEHLNGVVCKEKWDRVKIILKQSFSKNKQMGIEFVRIRNSRTLKDKKIHDSRELTSQTSKENLESPRNHWKNSPLARLRHQIESGKTPEINDLKDKLLRISGTTEDGSSNENTLTRTAKMVLSSRSKANHSQKSTKSIAKFLNGRSNITDSKDTCTKTVSSQSRTKSDIKSPKASSTRFDLKITPPRACLSRITPRCTIRSPKSDIKSLKASSTGLDLKNTPPRACPSKTTPQCSIRSPKSLTKLAPTDSPCTSSSSNISSPIHKQSRKHRTEITSTSSNRTTLHRTNDDSAIVAHAASSKFEQCDSAKFATANLRGNHKFLESSNSTRQFSDAKYSKESPRTKTSAVKNQNLTDAVEPNSNVSMDTGDISKSEIEKIKKKIERFFNGLDMEEMDPDKVTLKELRVGFEVMNGMKLDKNGRDYFRNATASFMDLVMRAKKAKINQKKMSVSIERKRKSNSETATTSKSRRLSSESDCEIIHTTQEVRCPLCMNYFPRDIIADHAALCGEDPRELASGSSPQQQNQTEKFIDLSDNMGLTEAEKQRWLQFSRKPKPYHPRMDKSLFQGQQLVKCPTCGQYYKSNEIEEHSDECAEKVNSGFVKRGLYFVKDGS